MGNEENVTEVVEVMEVATFTLKPLTHTQKPKMIFATTLGYSWEKPVNYTTPPPVPQKKRTTPGPKKPTWYDTNAELLLLSPSVLRQASQLLAESSFCEV